MKKAISVLAFAATFALAACGGGNAHAAPLNEIFTASPATTLFNVAGAIAVEKVVGGVKVTTAGVDAAGQPVNVDTAYSDSNGTAFANFQAQAAANGYFKVGASNRYLSAKTAMGISCASGALSQFTYVTGTQSANDACTMFYAVKAVSN